MALTGKQQRFVAEYLVDLNATQAAIRAGYSAKTAFQMGAENLRKPKIAALVAEAQSARAERTEVTQDRVLTELARIGFGDIRQLFDESGRLLRPEEWPDAAAAAVASIEVVTREVGKGDVEHVAKIRAWDKPRALEMAGKHLGMFRERMDVSGELISKIEHVIVRPKDRNA